MTLVLYMKERVLAPIGSDAERLFPRLRVVSTETDSEICRRMAKRCPDIPL